MERIASPPCSSGKRSYRRQRNAKMALKKLQAIPGGTRSREVYVCPECGWYHLASPRKVTMYEQLDFETANDIDRIIAQIQIGDRHKIRNMIAELVVKERTRD